HVVAVLLLHGSRRLQQPGLRRERAVAADPVDGAVARGREEPGPRARRRSVPRPALRRKRARLPGGFLGEVEVAEEADQRGEDASPLLAEDLVESGQRLSPP